MKILVGINGDAESFLTAVMLREQGNDVMGGVINCAGANVLLRLHRPKRRE